MTESKRHDGGKHEGAARTSPYPVSRLAPAVDLVDVAREIERADEVIGSVVGGKLGVIAEQIRALQEQAKEILDEARRDLDLHRATCSFPKRVGAIYHLYERSNGELYFSMVSPDEWGGAPPHAFRGSYRLEGDQSWTPAEDAAPRKNPSEVVARLLAESTTPRE